MTYETVRAGVLSVIRKLADYDEQNSSDGDRSILARAPQKACVIDQATEPVVEEITRSTQRWTHGVLIEVYTPISLNDVPDASRRDVEDEAEDISRHINSWWKLDGTSGVINAVARQFGVAEPVQDAQGGLEWWLCQVIVSVQEIVELTLNE